LSERDRQRATTSAEAVRSSPVIARCLDAATVRPPKKNRHGSYTLPGGQLACCPEIEAIATRKRAALDGDL
jgi:hypothetical protein